MIRLRNGGGNFGAQNIAINRRRLADIMYRDCDVI
jgi:hypothetical protein